MKYSVITMRGVENNTYFIVPLENEDDFVDMDCDTGVYEYAPLGIMLALTKAYTNLVLGKGSLEHGQFTIQPQHRDLEQGMLARVVFKSIH